jgi:hypothetical protein
MSCSSSSGLSRRSSLTTPPTPCVRVPRHVAWLVIRLVIDYFPNAAHPVASAGRAACRVTHRRLLRLAQARRRLLRQRRASGCLGTSCGSSSTSSTTPSVRVPRHVAQLVVDYFDYAAHPGASARRVARHPALRRLLRLRRASRCLGMSRSSSRGSSHRSSSTTPPTPRVRVPRHVVRLVTRLVIDYFTYAAHPVASARRATCRVTHRRLLHLAQARRRLLSLRRASGASARRAAHHAARRRLLRLRRASGCLGTLRSSLSTTSTTPRIRVPRHVVRLVTRLFVDYFDYAARPGASTCRAARHAARHAARY